MKLVTHFKKSNYKTKNYSIMSQKIQQQILKFILTIFNIILNKSEIPVIFFIQGAINFIKCEMLLCI